MSSERGRASITLSSVTSTSGKHASFAEGSEGSGVLGTLAAFRKGGRTLTFEYLPSATRERWSTSIHFVLAAVGSAVGIGNILRFPSLCYEYGGFSFLIPYMFAVAFIGLPVLASETMLGQMLQRSAIKAYAHIHPRLWGLGCYVTWGAMMLCSYYNVILSWSWVYLVFSFISPLPWGATTESAGEFFYGRVLHMQLPPGSWAETGPPDTDIGGIMPDRWSLDDGLGSISWEVAVGVLVQWFFCFICIHRGYRTIQRVVVIVVILPFVFLLALMFYGITLTGADVGLKAYVDPTQSPSKLLEWGAWVSAANQIFFGLSLSLGIMVAYASHEPRASKVVRNSWIIAVVNFIFSLVSGFGVFALIGHFSSVSNLPLDEVAGTGFELAFQTFPASFSGFQGATGNALSVLFFVTLLTLGLTSAMSMVQSVSEAFIDNLAWCRERVVIVNASVCIVGFCFSLLMATKSGYYIIDIVDHFTANYILLLGGAISTATVAWGYPSQKLAERVKGVTEMDARWLPFLWPTLVKFITPAPLLLLFTYNLSQDLMQPYGDYPLWALFVFGWTPAVMIPAFCFGLPSLIIPIIDSEQSHQDLRSMSRLSSRTSRNSPSSTLHSGSSTLRGSRESLKSKLAKSFSFGTSSKSVAS